MSAKNPIRRVLTAPSRRLLRGDYNRGTGLAGIRSDVASYQKRFGVQEARAATKDESVRYTADVNEPYLARDAAYLSDRLERAAERFKRLRPDCMATAEAMLSYVPQLERQGESAYRSLVNWRELLKVVDTAIAEVEYKAPPNTKYEPNDSDEFKRYVAHEEAEIRKQKGGKPPFHSDFLPYEPPHWYEADFYKG